MKTRSLALTTLLVLGVSRLPAADPAPQPPAAAPAAPDMAALADRRLDEMLNRMQAAVEEIAGLYGNPTFLQVFTNDPDRAAELKLRPLKSKSNRSFSGAPHLPHPPCNLIPDGIVAL